MGVSRLIDLLKQFSVDLKEKEAKKEMKKRDVFPTSDLEKVNKVKHYFNLFLQQTISSERCIMVWEYPESLRQCLFYLMLLMFKQPQ